ncbi:DUF4907 domain-containing protein [Spirosoma spitsbergense]|uniref:DUF4907 domain-containing protein n=1 Tax=Spirosoma spitsbergense TaxID=431554 RepID=UPI00035DC185|nr:DUF4907 domain-containing protein [Spirosoma spitsbergense]
MPVVTTSTQTKLIRLLLGLLLIGLAATTAYQLYDLRQNHYQVQVIRSPNGWGYDILNNGKPFIHQPTIPGVPGMVAFSSQEQARRVGERVVEKIQQTEALPTLTNEELRQLGVKIP